jgi:hypothetical protein
MRPSSALLLPSGLGARCRSFTTSPSAAPSSERMAGAPCNPQSREVRGAHSGLLSHMQLPDQSSQSMCGCTQQQTPQEAWLPQQAAGPAQQQASTTANKLTVPAHPQAVAVAGGAAHAGHHRLLAQSVQGVCIVDCDGGAGPGLAGLPPKRLVQRVGCRSGGMGEGRRH